MTIRIVANDLKIANCEDEFQLHCAALEWSLAEPIIINSAEDIKSRADWKDRVEPFYHQVQNLMRFCRRLPVTLLADDVGLGKTISAGLIVSELMKRSKISKVFVICPKILIPQWIEELGSKFGIEAFGVTGAGINSARNRTEPVIVTTYQSATGFLEKKQTGLFDMLILDEAHKVRNLHGTPNPPKMATAVYKALEARLFKYVVMLTATPIQNRLWDIYSLIDCLAVARGHKNPFGTPDQFTARFIADGRNVARRLKEAHTDEFRKIVSTYMFRTRRIDAKLAFPERDVQTYLVRPTADEIHLQNLIASNIENFNSLQQTSLLVALMSSPHALSTQLENMSSNNSAYSKLSQEVKTVALRIPIAAKSEAVLKIATDLKAKNPNWRMVVFTTRKETQRMLGEVLSAEGMNCGFISGGETAKNRNTIEAFRADKPKINVIVSTDAGAEGVNLQTANVLVNYDLPWNPMIVEQRIGRVQRIGSKFRNVYIVNIVHQNSPEQRIVGRLMEKLQVISHTVGDIEAVLEASNDPNGDSLEKQIREMVVASLKGQDQEAAARKAEQSIEDAKKLIEQNKTEMDQALGTGSDNEEADVPMPRLKPALPSVTMENFVVNALRAEGAIVTNSGNGLYSVSSEGLGEERFTFDEAVFQQFTQPGVFMGRSPLLYQPGKPAFERLVQRWIDRSGALVRDARTPKGDIEQIARDWLSTIADASIVNSQVSERSELFEGRIYCRTRVSNAVDSYEKLIRVQYMSKEVSSILQADLSSDIQVKSLLPSINEKVTQNVGADSDIRQFREYYELRLKTELERSDGGARKTKLINDLAPSVTADVSAVDGTISDCVNVCLQYSLGGQVQYQSTLVVGNGTILKQPDRAACGITGRQLPVECLHRCSVTGKNVMRELLQKSDLSGDLAIPDVFEICESTGKRVHRGEIGICSISGKRVCTSQLTLSQLSGRLALSSYAIKCQITDAVIFKEESQVSRLSGKRFRKDEAVVLADDKAVAHKSEATECHYSMEWYRKNDCALSDVTSLPVAKKRLAFSDVSKRKCDVSEIQVCEVTKKRLLPDEVGLCSISGKQVQAGLLQTCAETGRIGQRSLMVQCQISGDYAVPEEIESCCLTNKKVRKSLLGSSDVSGRRCLANMLVKCDESKIMLLPEESGTCSVTGENVDLRCLETCTVSGKVAIATKLVRSGASGKLMLPQYTKSLPNGMTVGIDEYKFCNWSREHLCVDQISECTLCGLTFAKNFMNPNSEFSLLRECLDGRQKGPMFPEPGFLARIHPNQFSSIVIFQWISSENGKAHILFGKKSTFGLNVKIFAVMAEGDMTGLKLKGKILWGRRVKKTWQPLTSTTN